MTELVVTTIGAVRVQVRSGLRIDYKYSDFNRAGRLADDSADRTVAIY